MYDVAIIGGGPGGYTCAIRAQARGESLRHREERTWWDVRSARMYSNKVSSFDGGYNKKENRQRKMELISPLKLNYQLLRSRMVATVSRLALGIKHLLETNEVDLIEGEASIKSANKIVVDNGSVIETRNLVIATGSLPTCLPGYQFGEYTLNNVRPRVRSPP